MSANFHTALPSPVALTTANLESPLSQLDQAITNLTTGSGSSAYAFSQINFGAFNAKTISSGAIVGDKTLVTVDTEASAASDDLDNITSPTAGDLMFIKIANSARVVTIRNNGGGSGNIRTYNGLNVILSDTNQIILLLYNGSNWNVFPTHFSATTFALNTATISSDTITFSASYMVIDTQGSASTDDLSTISGGVAGAFLILSTASSSRDVTIKHNVGNIQSATGSDIVLDTVNKFVILVYNGTSWLTLQDSLAFNDALATTGLVSNRFQVPAKSIVTSGHPFASATQPFIDFAPFGGLRQPRVLTAADTTLEGYGFGTLTVSGTPSNNYNGSTQDTGSLVRFLSGGSTGNLAGVVSPFTLTSREMSPFFRIIFSTYNSVASSRIWIGLSSAAVGATDVPSGSSVHFMGLRFANVSAGDTVWQFVTSDGTTTNVVSSGYGIATDTMMEFVMYVNASGNVVMSIRSMAFTTYVSATTSTNLPGNSTPLGLNARIETRENVAKSIQISGVGLYH